MISIHRKIINSYIYILQSRLIKLNYIRKKWK